MLKVALLAAFVAPMAAVRPLSTQAQTTRECVNGKWHTTNYRTSGGASSEVMVDLDSMEHLKAVNCDLDGSRLQLKFSSVAYAAEYFAKFHDWNDHFLVGGTKWNCSIHQTGNPGLIIRRIVGADDYDLSDTLLVKASTARYDEIYEDADIEFASEGSCAVEDARGSKDKQVCVAWNSDCTGTATQRLNIYSNKQNTVNLACENCFVDFEMDVFVNVQIRGWQVANLSTGFRNMAVNASTIITAEAKDNWNTGIDKTLPVLQNQYLVDFKIGPVPFMVFFDLPVRMQANFQFASDALATFGAQVNLGLGDAFVSWDPVNHWTHAKPAVTLAVAPQLTTTATLDATGTVAVTPVLTAHFDRLLSYQLTATPEIDFEIKGSEASKQVCLTSTYNVGVKSVTTLDINIPWANIAKDWTWPKDVYESGTTPIENKCINL